MEIYFDGNKKVFADFEGYTVKTDQSLQAGGDAEYPEPFQMFIASLGTCAGIFVKYFCDKREIPTDKIHLTQEVHFDPERHIIGSFDLSIHVPGDFPEKYEQAMMHAASVCTVKRHMREDIDFNIKVVRE